jgi:hypothetical protein
MVDVKWLNNMFLNGLYKPSFFGGISRLNPLVTAVN